MNHVPEADRTPDGPVYEGRLLARPDDELVDQGAAFDAKTLVTRRRMLGLVGAGVGAVTLAACYPGSSSSSSAGSVSGSTTTTAASGSSIAEIPEETNGPYPADGTNGVNVLQESGIVRSDLTSSLDGGTTVEGVPFELTFVVTDMANGNVPFAGAAVYAWQCDAQGLYSMYSQGAEDETYLRGIQVADSNGELTFKTIVPGCYTGRWTLRNRAPERITIALPASFRGVVEKNVQFAKCLEDVRVLEPVEVLEYHDVFWLLCKEVHDLVYVLVEEGLWLIREG
ncbi:hypothetical protein [Gordonia sp. NB41Y]|uniref:dioxygenase family protein n=1 Tax=Gordonia sp. NB41Y TaxID=875808 RepID=UPI0009EB6BCA|nr:hypothetical protein [Gordonia sp. NB41Y]WLP90727.1 hypothetical protein Q9K23_25150 [Gordonia sp. NB41Y]